VAELDAFEHQGTFSCFRDVARRVSKRPWFFARQTIELLLSLTLLVWLCWSYYNSHLKYKVRAAFDAALARVMG